MISAYNSHWWAPDAWAPPRLLVCGGIQVFAGSRDLARAEECGRGPCSRGPHSLLMQHNNNAVRHAKADTCAQRNRAAQHTPEQHKTMQRLSTQSWRRCTEEQRSAVHTRGARTYKGNTTQHIAQQSKIPTPRPPHKTTEATRTHTTRKDRFPDPLLGANNFPTTPGSGGSPNLSRGVAPAGGWQPATWLTIGQQPKTCIAHE